MMAREEVIKWLTQKFRCEKQKSRKCLDIECSECKCDYEEKKEIDVLKIAIDELEKLQKIESLYATQEFGKGISREERDREVQKILEES